MEFEDKENIFLKSYILNTENQTEFINKEKPENNMVNILSVTTSVKLFIP